MATSDINTVVIVGRLTRDADLRYTNNGGAIASLSVAVNRSKKDGEQWVSEVNYFDVSYFGKGAEAVKPYLTKGKQIAISGSLRQDRWEKDGQKFSKVVINADSVELLGGRADGGNGAPAFSGQPSSFGGYQQQNTFAPQQSQPNSFSQNDTQPFGDDSYPPEDIPF